MAHHPRSVENLRLTIARSQLRGLLAYIALISAVTVLLAVFWALGGQGGSVVGAWALGAGIGALIGLYAYIAYARAFTECTPAGLRTRGLGGLQECPWSGVSDASLRPHGRTATVMVTTTSGTRFRLGVPVDGGVMRDPEFMGKVQQVVEYWHSATEEPTGPRTGSSPSSP